MFSLGWLGNMDKKGMLEFFLKTKFRFGVFKVMWVKDFIYSYGILGLFCICVGWYFLLVRS